MRAVARRWHPLLGKDDAEFCEEAAIDFEVGPGDETRIVARQERHGFRDFPGLADAAKRMTLALGHERAFGSALPLVEVGGVAQHRRVDRGGANMVERHGAYQGADPALAGRVGRDRTV